VLDYGKMSNLPASLAKALEGAFPSAPLAVEETLLSSDRRTRKLILRALDGERIETVVIPAGRRITACISTQAGCALGCRICATGAGGFRRNLRLGEILAQVLLAAEAARRRITNIVLMGMGEPLLNFESVSAAIRAWTRSRGPGPGARRITVSTVGVVGGIEKLCHLPQHPNLAVSLHGATPSTRAALVPSARRWPLRRILEAAERYGEVSGRPVTYEVVLVRSVNSSPQDAEALGRLLRDRRAKVNLIPLNPVSGTSYEPPSSRQIQAFRSRLGRFGVSATLRSERGADISAACGQLRGTGRKKGKRS
jgi:23S rRNA (adenine2503-C2)-methyltransferase